MIHRRRPQLRTTERGAVSVVVAFLAIALMACGALAIDLGSAYTRARAVQAEADFAALSAGNLLPATTNADKLAVSNRIADYINSYQLSDDRAGGRVAVTGQGLLDSGAVNFPAANRVTVAAPKVQINFGLAKAIGASSIQVTRSATVQASSLSSDVVAPLYAVNGCDYGNQVLKDSPHGPPASTLPPLDDMTSMSNKATVTSVSPSSVTANQTPVPTLTVQGDFEGTGGNPKPLATKIGFYRDNTGPYTPYWVAATPTTITATSATVPVPAGVISQEGVWYVRALLESKWSPPSASAYLIVGTAATPTCPAGSSGGNFGTLGFGDQSNPNDDIAQVLKTGPEHEVTSYPGSPTPAECGGLPSPAVHYPGLTEPANCVFTEPGFKPNAVTDGLITDSNARLRKNTTPRCGPSQRTQIGVGINDDYLSCFLTNDTATVGSISTSAYTGPAVLSPEIVSSPRFFFVPIFSAEPDTGKKEYKITGFRPGFLTDQPTSATRLVGPTGTNGVTIGSNNKVAAVNFILFSEKALPSTLDAGPPTSPVYSYGPKVIQLVK